MVARDGAINLPTHGFTSTIVEETLSAIEQEREYVEAEISAFRAFISEVQSVPTPTQQTAGDAMVSAISTSTTENGLQTVRECYRDTVMSVPGYENEYGENIQENIAGEFSEEMATAIIETNRFTQPLKQLFVAHGQDAIKKRNEFLEVIDTEYASVSDVHTRMQETKRVLEREMASELLQYSFSELAEYRQDLQRNNHRCEQLLKSRQRGIHRMNSRFHRVESLFLQEYLYTELDVSFPALTAILNRLRELSRRQRTVTHQLSRRR